MRAGRRRAGRRRRACAAAQAAAPPRPPDRTGRRCPSPCPGLATGSPCRSCRGGCPSTRAHPRSCRGSRQGEGGVGGSSSGDIGAARRAWRGKGHNPASPAVGRPGRQLCARCTCWGIAALPGRPSNPSEGSQCCQPPWEDAGGRCPASSAKSGAHAGRSPLPGHCWRRAQASALTRTHKVARPEVQACPWGAAASTAATRAMACSMAVWRRRTTQIESTAGGREGGGGCENTDCAKNEPPALSTFAATAPQVPPETVTRPGGGGKPQRTGSEDSHAANIFLVRTAAASKAGRAASLTFAPTPTAHAAAALARVPQLQPACQHLHSTVPTILHIQCMPEAGSRQRLQQARSPWGPRGLLRMGHPTGEHPWHLMSSAGWLTLGDVAAQVSRVFTSEACRTGRLSTDGSTTCLAAQAAS